MMVGLVYPATAQAPSGARACSATSAASAAPGRIWRRKRSAAGSGRRASALAAAPAAGVASAGAARLPASAARGPLSVSRAVVRGAVPQAADLRVGDWALRAVAEHAHQSVPAGRNTTWGHASAKYLDTAHETHASCGPPSCQAMACDCAMARCI